MALLEAENISVSFDNRQVLNKVSIKLNKDEIVSLLGVSGGGKTTLFNVISGLLTPDEGKVYLNGTDITGIPGHISYMLQKDLLMPYKTVLDNVCLPLTIKGVRKKEARRQAMKYFEEFGLSGTGKMYPAALSGGMRQRAALLRTYLFSRQVALLDEPFSALDTITKKSMHEWYLNIMNDIKLSTILITHDVDEAILLSDRIYVLGKNPGHIIKEFTIAPEDVRNSGLELSDKFLQYKKSIIAAIGD